jgi:hypothetical protein
MKQGLARRTDPQTSQDAARSIDPSGQQAAILRTLAYLVEANRYEISRACGLTEYQAGRRLSELERDRRIIWTGRTRAGESGRQQRVWTIMGEPVQSELWEGVKG